VAIDCDPNFSDAYIDRGIVYYRMGDLKRALGDIGQAKRRSLRPGFFNEIGSLPTGENREPFQTPAETIKGRTDSGNPGRPETGRANPGTKRPI
jgi:hypothetical protein